MKFEVGWVPVLTVRGIGSTSSSTTIGSGLGNTWTSEDRFPQCRTAWKGEYAWSISLLWTYKGVQWKRDLCKCIIHSSVQFSQLQSYPNRACTLFMHSGPSIVKICPSPPLIRSSSSRLSMASVICNCKYTRQWFEFITVTKQTPSCQML